MRNDTFFAILNDIDDKYIEEAENYKKKSTMPLFISIAASAILLAGIVTAIIQSNKDNIIETASEETVQETILETHSKTITNNAVFARNHLLNYLNGDYPDDTVILSVTLSDATSLNGSKGGYIPEDQEALKAALTEATKHKQDKVYKSFPWEDMLPIEVYFCHDGITDNWILASDGSLWGGQTSDTTDYDPQKNNYIPAEHAKQLAEKVMESYNFLEIAPITPDQIGDISSAELNVEGSSYILTDKQKLKTLKDDLSNAKSNTPSGCSWGILELTLEDGRNITLALASDSCAIWHSDGKYYRYKNAEEVYELFGIDLAKLHAPKED